MDKFEKHIRDHQRDFDEHKVDREKLWSKISEGLDQKSTPQKLITPPISKRWWQRRSLQLAASIALIIGLGLGLLFNQANQNQAIAEPTELLEIDFYYEKIIAQQVKLIEDSPQLTAEEKQEFLAFFEEMDDEYLDLKRELQEGIEFESILEAIIVHYQKRLDITESMLNRINSSENEKEQKGILL